jgi:hypothetical protein
VSAVVYAVISPYLLYMRNKDTGTGTAELVLDEDFMNV